MFQTESLVGALSCVKVSTISSRMECAYFSLEFWMKRPCIFHGTVFKVFSAATRRYIDDSKGKKSMAVGQTLSYHLGAHLALVASLSNFFFGRLRPPRKHTIRSRVLLPCWFHSFEERPLLLASPLCRLLGFPLSFSASLGLHSSRSSFPRIRFCRRQSQRPLPLQGDGGAAQNELDFFTKKNNNKSTFIPFKLNFNLIFLRMSTKMDVLLRSPDGADDYGTKYSQLQTWFGSFLHFQAHSFIHHVKSFSGSHSLNWKVVNSVKDGTD